METGELSRKLQEAVAIDQTQLSFVPCVPAKNPSAGFPLTGNERKSGSRSIPEAIHQRLVLPSFMSRDIALTSPAQRSVRTGPGLTATKLMLFLPC
jgi:hypothetical protein